MARIPERRKTVRRKDENALRKSEERYRNILENIEEGYYELDLAGNFTFFNDSMRRMMGYPREELLGMNNRVYTNKETAKKLFQAFNEVYRTGKPARIVDYEIVRKDGTKRYIEISISLHKDSSSKPIGFRGIVRDITERKSTEEELRQSEERYRSILEEMQEGYFELDLTGNFTFVNNAECRNLGYSREELIGMNNRQYQDEATVKKMNQFFNTLYKTGKPFTVLDVEVIRKDGTKRFNEISASLLRNTEGKPAGFKGITRDITERKLAENALYQTEEKYRTILEDMEEGYFEVNLEGNFTFVNDAECKNLGYSREELIGMNNRQYTDKENAKKVFLAFSNLYKTGEPCKIFDYEITKKDGTKEVNELLVSLIKDSKGKPIGFRGLTRQITERKQAEEALQKSETRYRLLAENMTDAVWLMDMNLSFVYSSPSLEKLIGYTDEEIKQMPPEKLLTPASFNNAIAVFSEEMVKVKADSSYLFERTLQLEVYRKDGTKFWSEDTFSLIRDENGNPLYMLAEGRDITERRLMEEILIKSEEKYRTILEEMKEGYYEIDLAGNFTFLNDAGCKHLGYSREELIGINNRQYTDANNAKKALQAFNKVYRTGEPYRILDYETIKKDGTKTILELSVSVTRDSDGKPTGFRGISRDITERKRMEDNLRQSEERYRTILEEMEESYFELDLAGNFTFINDAACKYSGYSREEMIGMNNRKYQTEETAKKMYHFLSELYKKGEPFKLSDVEIIKKDWTKAFNEISISLIKDAEGKPIGFRGVSRDITERKQAEDVLEKNREELIIKNKEIEESRNNMQMTLEKLEKAYEDLKTSQLKILQQEKMASIGQLAAGVAHEINNPMAFVASNLGTLDKYIHRFVEFIQFQSEVIESYKVDDAIKGLKKKRKELKLDYITEDVSQLIKESLEGSERVQQIVQGLNRFSRLDQAEYKAADINACIEDSITIAWNELKHKVTLKKDYGNLPPTKCFPQQLNQVFINLLINASQAIEKKGKIKIKTWEKDKLIWITISDTGCGIPQKNFNKVFEPFFTSKDTGQGTGLGLSITYEIIQRHKGEITFESEERKGTTFTISLPIV